VTPLLVANTRKTVLLLAEEFNAPPYGLFGPLGGAAPSLCDGAGSRYSSPEKDYFAFYAVRAIVRSILRSVNYLAAAHLLVQKRLPGPATATGYTAAFHLVTALLATEGHVIFNEPRWSPDGGTDTSGKAFAARLNKNNQWSFEGQNRGHTARWKSLERVHDAGRLPECFADLYPHLMWSTIKSENLPKVMSEHIREFLVKIARTRHVSLYESRAMADQFFDEMWNERKPDLHGFMRLSQAFLDFAMDLLAVVVTDAIELLTTVADAKSPELSGALFCSVLTPDIDPAFGVPDLPVAARTLLKRLRAILQPSDT